MSEPIQAILIGAGHRGAEVYARYALKYPEELQIVAVAEPIAERRIRFSNLHRIPPERQFISWEQLLSRPRMASAALICTQDQMHTAPTIAALKAGYHVLLEKPMATTLEDCCRLVTIAEQTGRLLQVCHVLRYTPHFRLMKEIIQSGELGEIVTVDHRENVSWWHMAHSYVRGNWRKRAESAPMILAKCCHDLDILIWLLGRCCESLSSVGGLIHFRPENAPAGAPERCLDGCPAAEQCSFYAPFIYKRLIPFWRSVQESLSPSYARWAIRSYLCSPNAFSRLAWLIPPLREISEYRKWPRNVITADPTEEGLMAALASGPYGRCVYHCDNDIVDHQVVSMRFEGGISVTLTMHGHSNLEGRTTRIQGTRAELQAYFGLVGGWVEVRWHRTGQRRRYNTNVLFGGGHGGGDYGVLQAFISTLQRGEENSLTTAHQALESHLMAFAADLARRESRVVPMTTFRETSPVATG